MADMTTLEKTLADEISTRVSGRSDGGYSVEFFLNGDDRHIAHLTIHERGGTKLYRKLDFGLQTRVDGPVRKDFWQMRITRVIARVLR